MLLAGCPKDTCPAGIKHARINFQNKPAPGACSVCCCYGGLYESDDSQDKLYVFMPACLMGRVSIWQNRFNTAARYDAMLEATR